MDKNRNGFRRIDGGVTPDGFAIYAEYDFRNRVRIVKERTPDYLEPLRTDKVIFYPNRPPEVSRSIIPATGPASFRGIPITKTNIPFDRETHTLGVQKALPELLKKAEAAGWDDDLILQLETAGRRISYAPANAPKLYDRFRLSVQGQTQDNGCKLGARKLWGGQVEIFVTRQSDIARSAGAPDVQRYDLKNGLTAVNYELYPSHTPVHGSVPTQTNPKLFAETLSNGLAEVLAKTETNRLWSVGDSSELLFVAELFGRAFPELVPAVVKASTGYSVPIVGSRY